MVPLSGKFWTIITFIITVVVTILIYKLSDKKIEPVYTVTKEPSLIFDKTNFTPKIKLISKDSIIVDKNVYVTNIAIWNEGKLEIKKSDIRQDIRLLPSLNTEILDYEIVKEVKPDISNFRIINNNEYLTLDWDYFDPNFGLEIQVIYAGNDSSKINVDGYVIGTEIKKLALMKVYKGVFITLLIVISPGFILFLWIAITEWSKLKVNANLVYIIFVIVLWILTELWILSKVDFFSHHIPF